MVRPVFWRAPSESGQYNELGAEGAVAIGAGQIVLQEDIQARTIHDQKESKNQEIENPVYT